MIPSTSAAQCVYCNPEKPSGAMMTLEHTIPQFLGGAYAPNKFKSNRVCQRCNSLLGMFVDGSFARTWWVSNWLRNAARAAYDPVRPIGLPLICMGPTKLQPPEISADEVCELWLGPQGEQVYWIRPHDERLYWYSGGNPRTAKEIDSRAYFYFAQQSNDDQLKTWLSFRDAFAEERVKKVMCTQVAGANPKDIGFSDPDERDRSRIEYFTQHHIENPCHAIALRIEPTYDHRFMAKLGLGLGFSVFGDEYLSTAYAKELQKGTWFRGGAGGEVPQVRGQTALSATQPLFHQLTGLPDAVTLTLFPTQDALVLILDIGRHLSWKVAACLRDQLPNSPGWAWLDSGQTIVMYKYLQTAVMLSFPEFLAHVNGTHLHQDLVHLTMRLNLAQRGSGVDPV
jgi:hypothetical protein